MYCRRCGKVIDNNSKFCPECGEPTGTVPPYGNTCYNQNQQYNNTCTMPKKDVGVTVILALVGGLLFFNGIGQIYVGKIGRGLSIMLFGWLLGAATIISMISFDITNVNITFGTWVIFAFCELALFIWQAYDAYMLANEYNKRTCETGHPPW
ncbi:MAG: zinc ribbon domain-containing protein [Candidatus Methanogranum gryphiswaldense]|nr:MAG: zinc ribbon domain-containing protein [Candidatus Methanogranum sp. U3.2.1]